MIESKPSVERSHPKTTLQEEGLAQYTTVADDKRKPASQVLFIFFPFDLCFFSPQVLDKAGKEKWIDKMKEGGKKETR